MLQRLLAALLAAFSLFPLSAGAVEEYTHVKVVNGTAYWIWVDSYQHLGTVHHHSLVPPSDSVIVERRQPDTRFFTDIHVYVKKYRSTDPADTLCQTMRTFGNTTGKPTIVVHVHYRDGRCSIDDV